MYDIIRMPCANYGSRHGQVAKGIIVHCFGLALRESIAYLLTNNVSAHYFIPQITMKQMLAQHPELMASSQCRYPNAVPVIMMVAETESAWHAGHSYWKDWNKLEGCANTLNPCTIGVEFHAPGYDDVNAVDIANFTPFTELQIATGAALLKDITRRWAIQPENILAHSDISFLRAQGPCKTDPGPLFPWRELYVKHSIGLFPGEGSVATMNYDIATLQRSLQKIGYHCPPSGELDSHTQHCINAYRLHYMAENWRRFSGAIDDELIKSIYAYPGIS